MLQTKEELLNYLDKQNIAYKNHVHPAVYTVEEAARYAGDIEGAHCKNLFFKDKKKNLFLVSTLCDKSIVIKEVAEKIGAKGMRFGAPELLAEVLGVIPGAVTPFAVVNANGHPLKLILDGEMMEHKLLNFHPLENTATTSISDADLVKFVKTCGVDFEIHHL